MSRLLSGQVSANVQVVIWESGYIEFVYEGMW